MSMKITSDSTCDLSPELLERYRIKLSPLTVIKDGKAYLDGVDITPDDIFRHVDKGGSLCSTSAVNVESYRKMFAELSPQYEDVIHITLGSLFSACYQNAAIAAKALDDDYAGTAEKLPVEVATGEAEAAAEGEATETEAPAEA